jgi:predicted TIM-barrel fold metal-dependent hydrolase
VALALTPLAVESSQQSAFLLTFLTRWGEATFPKLRWGFIEASAQWVPWIYREAKIRYRVANRAFPENVFEDYNIFVTCQVNDDVPYIVSCAGEDCLVIGTDYGHTDPSSAVTALNEFQRLDGIDAAVKEKILSHNAKALYGL